MGYRDIEVPSFWDYLGQGLSAGVGGFQDAQHRKDVLAQQQREDEFRKWQALMQLHQQGALPEDQNKPLSDLTRKVTGTPIAIGPSPAQVRTRLALSPAQGFATPPVALPGGGLLPAIKVQGTQGTPASAFEFAGLKTPAQLQAEQTGDQANILHNQALQRIASNQGTPQDFTLTGLKSPEEVRFQRITQLQPILDNAAQRHIMAAAAGTKGRLDPRALSQTADKAFNTFMSSDKQAQNLALSPSESADVQNAFRAKATELYLDQHKQDVMEELKRLEISSRFSQSRSGQTANALGKMLTSIDGELNKMGIVGGMIPSLKDRHDALLQAKAEAINALGNVADENFESNAQQVMQRITPLLGGGAGGAITPRPAGGLTKPSSLLGTKPRPGNVLAPPSGAPGAQPASGAAVGGVGKMQITADQAEFLKAKNGFQWWDANKGRFEVK